MIDWIKAVIPLAHAKRICGGIVQSIDLESGEVEWQVHKRQKVEGSYSSTVQVRSTDAGHIEIDGNPSKFLQGQNVFGSNDLLALCTAFFQEVVACLRLRPSEFEIARWKSGLYDLKRVDVAECFQLPSQRQ